MSKNYILQHSSAHCTKLTVLIGLSSLEYPFIYGYPEEAYFYVQIAILLDHTDEEIRRLVATK